MTAAPSALDRARAAWGPEMPAWIEALAREVDRTSMRLAGRRIGYSATVVHRVLARSYAGSWPRIERAVRLALMPDAVSCPILGEIDEARCLHHQRNPAWANHVLAALARHCPVCPHREEERP